MDAPANATCSPAEVANAIEAYVQTLNGPCS